MTRHYMATAALLAATAAAIHHFSRPGASVPPAAGLLSSLTLSEEGWEFAANQPLPAPVLRALKPTAYVARAYRRDGEALDLFVAYYAQQRSGESMHSPKHCLPGAGWEIWKQETVETAGGERINKHSISNGNQRLLMFYWYQSPLRVVAGELEAKLLLARDTLLTGQTAGSLVRFTLRDTEAGHREGAVIAARLIAQMRRCFSGEPLSTASAR